MSKKTETIEEFLARGGKIDNLDPVKNEVNDVTVRGTAITPPTLYHLTEGQYLFAEKKKNKSKKKKLSAQEVSKKLESIRSIGK